MKLTKEIVKIVSGEDTPVLLLDLANISLKYHEIRNSIRNVEIFYAMKANNDPKILKLLVDEGCGFEVASEPELRSVLSLGVPPQRIMSMHPIKGPKFLRSLESEGVEIMAFDSFEEVDKISAFAPGSKLVLRIIVDNEGSDWPLTRKFGVEASQAPDLIRYASGKGLNVYGLTFHVGSQCNNKDNWAQAIGECRNVWTKALGEGSNPQFISLGGGIPIRQTHSVPSLDEIGKVIADSVKLNFPTAEGLKLSIEPGRGLVGDSGLMVTTVLGKAKRGNENWIYVDAGVFNALMETVEHYKYEIKTLSRKKKKVFTIAGPSCDSVDVMFENVSINDVEIGDQLFILNSAAYTTVYASNFNGFSIPKIVYI